MVLSQTTVYALRAMAVLARLEPGESLRSIDLSERTGVPVHYLGKVMRQLVLAGLVVGRKGHGGGFALRRPPRDISFADILRAIGTTTGQGRCAFAWRRCDPDRPCPLHPAWSRLQESLTQWALNSRLDETQPSDFWL